VFGKVGTSGAEVQKALKGYVSPLLAVEAISGASKSASHVCEDLRCEVVEAIRLVILGATHTILDQLY